MANGTIDDRESYRIDDYAEVHYRPATEDELSANVMSMEFSKPGENDLEDVLEGLSQQSQRILHKLRDDNPLLADYLNVLENKIRIIASQLTVSTDTQSHKPVPINLSDTGLAFPTDEKLDHGTLLRLKLVLRPNYQEIAAYVRVVKIMTTEEVQTKKIEKPYWIATQIVRIPSLDQQKLAKHILNFQMTQRKKRLRDD